MKITGSATPTPLVCEDGTLVWFDTLKCISCFPCKLFQECVGKWAEGNRGGNEGRGEANEEQ